MGHRLVEGERELLKLGCEAIPLEWDAELGMWLLPKRRVYFPNGNYTGRTSSDLMGPWHLALPAYVASELVDRVWETRGLDLELSVGHPDVCIAQFTDEPTAKGTTHVAPGVRSQWVWCTIAAALVALDVITIKRARELLG